MISLNQVTLVGTLASDVFANGAASKFTVECTEGYVARDGSKGVRKDYVKCVAFGKTAEALKLNCKKGDRICVEGSVKPGSYEKDGHKVYTQDISVRAIHFDAGEDAKQVGPKNVFPESSADAMMDELSF